MLRELFNAISEQAVKAALPTLKPGPGDETLLLQPGQEPTTIINRPTDRNHRFLNITDFTAAVVHYAADRQASIWYSPYGLIAILDETTRFDRLALEFTATEQHVAINALPHTFDHRALLNFLRVAMADAIHPDVLSRLRSINFARNAAAVSTINQQDESLGRSVEAKVANADQIPTTITATLSLFDELVETIAIKLDVAISTTDETFTLKPLAGQRAHAERATLYAVYSRIMDQLKTLAAENVTVFAGKP